MKIYYLLSQIFSRVNKPLKTYGTPPSIIFHCSSSSPLFLSDEAPGEIERWVSFCFYCIVLSSHEPVELRKKGGEEKMGQEVYMQHSK